MITTKIIKQYLEEDEITGLEVSRRDQLFTVVIENKNNEHIEINKKIYFNDREDEEQLDEDSKEFIETVKQLMEYNVERNLPF